MQQSSEVPRPTTSATGRPAAPIYLERLWPSPTIWTVVALFGLALGLIPAPISTTAAVITSVVATVVLITLLAFSTPVVRVDATTFRAGRAHIPRALLGPAQVLDPQQLKAAQGLELDARAYMCTRGWLSQGVRVTLRDPADPTPYWLVSSRHPDRLAAALAPTDPGTPG